MTTSTHIDICLCDRCVQSLKSDDVMAGVEIDGQEPESTGRNVRGYGECYHCGDAEIDPALYTLEVRR